MTLILFEEILGHDLIAHKESYIKYLKIIELVNDNELALWINPYTIPFITGMWH